MEVAPRYKLFYTVSTVYTTYTVVTAYTTYTAYIAATAHTASTLSKQLWRKRANMPLYMTWIPLLLSWFSSIVISGWLIDYIRCLKLCQRLQVVALHLMYCCKPRNYVFK